MSEPGEPRLHELQRGDVEGIANILEAYRWERRYVVGQLEAVGGLATRAEGFVRVAGAGRQVVGFVAVEFYRCNRLVQIHGLAVAPDWARRGLASRLLSEAEDFREGERKARGIYADTPVSNEVGRAFYRARNYMESYRMHRIAPTNSTGLRTRSSSTKLDPARAGGTPR